MGFQIIFFKAFETPDIVITNTDIAKIRHRCTPNVYGDDRYKNQICCKQIVEYTPTGLVNAICGSLQAFDLEYSLMSLNPTFKCNQQNLRVNSNKPTIPLTTCTPNPNLHRFSRDSHSIRNVCMMFGELREANRISKGLAKNKNNIHHEYAYCRRYWPRHPINCAVESSKQEQISM